MPGEVRVDRDDLDALLTDYRKLMRAVADRAPISDVYHRLRAAADGPGATA